MNLLRLIFPKIYNKVKFKLPQEKIASIKYPLKHEVAFQFKCKVSGKDNFKFVNDLNMPVERALAAQDIYVELEQKTDAIYHETAYQSILDYLDKGELVNAGMVAYNSLERIQRQITNVDLMYKLASVLYFDEDENPYRYDVDYNQNKIKAWKQDPDIEGFFLKTGFGEYLKFFNSSKISIQEYTKIQRLRNVQIAKHQLRGFSEKSKATDLYSKLKSWVETLEKLIASEA